MDFRLAVRVGAHIYQNQKGEMNYRGDSNGDGISTSHQKRPLLSPHEARQRRYMGSFSFGTVLGDNIFDE